MSENPYQTPIAPDPGFTPASGITGSPEDIRHKHIGHEVSVKSIGTFYYIGAIIITLFLPGFFHSFNEASKATTMDLLIALLPLAISASMIVVLIFVGHGIQKLKPSARVAGIILSVLGLIGKPLSMLFSGYVLYLLVSPKAKVVFSPKYKEVIAMTPGVRHKTSTASWILITVVILLAVAFGVLMAFGD